MRILLLFGLLLIFLPIAAAQETQTNKDNKSASASSIGIVVDCSGSQRLQLDKTISVVKQIAETMRPGDEAFIVRFVDAQKITIVQDFTDQKQVLQDAVDDIYVEGGLTAIVDAVDLAARHLSESELGASSRVLVLITDGDDRKSTVRADETIALLKRENIRTFAIAFSDLKVSTKLLDKFTRDSGGKTYVPRTPAEVSNSVLELASAIRGETIIRK